MALTVIDFPESIARAVSITWEMDTNHGVSMNPYSGKPLAVRGLKERWKFSMSFKRMTRAQMQELQGFFMELEGPLHAFRMRDPSQPTILGTNTSNPTLAAGASAMDRSISAAGLDVGTAVLKAGDWIQLPTGQTTRVVKDVDGTVGNDTIEIWPMLWQDEAISGTVLASVASPAYGYYRFESRLPSWSADARHMARPFTSQLIGGQVILNETVSWP